jgi:integrase
MATMRLQYVHSFVDKTGKVRYYFRHRGKRWPLPGVPGSTEFSFRYDQLRRECAVTDKRPDNVRFAPHTLGSVIEKWLASDAFTSKSHNTKRQYRRVVDQIKEMCGRALIADLREEHVREIRSRFMPATFTADEAVMLLSTIWIFAKEHLAMKLGPNPTTDIQKLHRQAWSHEPWPDEVIAKFEAEARPQPNAQLALLLLLYTGQRAGDVAAMKWDRYDGKGIEVRQEKTATLVWIPCHSRLKAVLDRTARKSDFILTRQQGSGYSAGSFRNMVSEATAQIGAKEYTAHGLRKNAAIALAEADCTVQQVMAITGHKTWKEAMRYTQRREQRKLALQAMDKLEAATKVANPRTIGIRAAG